MCDFTSLWCLKSLFLALILLMTAVLCAGLVNDNGNKIMTVEMMNMTSDTNHNIIIQSLSSLNIF